MVSRFYLLLTPTHTHTHQNPNPRGTWMAQLVERLTLDFSLSYEFGVVGSSPASGSTLMGDA